MTEIMFSFLALYHEDTFVSKCIGSVKYKINLLFIIHLFAILSHYFPHGLKLNMLSRRKPHVTYCRHAPALELKSDDSCVVCLQTLPGNIGSNSSNVDQIKQID